MKKVLSSKTLRNLRRLLTRTKRTVRHTAEGRNISLEYIVAAVSRATKRPWEKCARSRRALHSLLRAEESLLELRSPIEQLRTDVRASARAQAWYDGLAARHREEWSTLRKTLLNSAQRAEDARGKVIG